MCWRQEERRCGRGRDGGQAYTGNATLTKKGLCKALGGNVLNYGQKAAADQMRTSWEKITEYVGTLYGQDVSKELQKKATVAIAEPTLLPAILQHTTAAREIVIRNGQ